MNILLVNDDGYNSKGLEILARSLSYQGRVYVAAPRNEQSAKSHAITIRNRLTYEEIDPIFGTARTVIIDGTPADCVRLGLKIYNDIDIDLVVSGVNHGANLANDVNYSGTVAAAREAKLQGFPSIAISAVDINASFVPDETHNILDVIINKAKGDYFLNINIPCVKPKGVKITILGSRIFHSDYRKVASEDAYSIGYSVSMLQETSDMDTVAIDNGFISITPLLVDSTDRKAMKTIEKALEK